MGTGFLSSNSWGQVFYRNSWGQVFYRAIHGDRFSIGQFMGTGFLSSKFMGTGFLSGNSWGHNSWGQVFYREPPVNHPFRIHPFRSSESVARRLALSTDLSAPGNESFHSHSTCRDALSPGVTTRFPGPADMGGTLAKTLNTPYPPRFTRAAHSAPVARPSRHSSDRVRRRALPIRLHA
jgi:hypothetical protein